MQKLNLCNPEKSDISYSISKFPDGEVQITLGEINRKDTVKVQCRITKVEDLFILMQVADILNRQGVEWDLFIYYLMGMRMDRVMDFNRPFTLKVVADVIKNLGYDDLFLLEPHSNRAFQLLNTGGEIYPFNDTYLQVSPSGCGVYIDYLVVYPDAGAAERYECGREVVVAKKVRNIETGKIESIEITNPELFKDNTKPIMVVDDLCDGGGTFIGLVEEIRKYTDKELNIFVTHMVNPRGIENLSRNYDHVYFTNSYRDWEIAWEAQSFPFPENCTQINVIDGNS